MEIGCSKCGDERTSSMVSHSESTYNMLSHHTDSYEQEVDFPLYPDPKTMFSQTFSFSTPQNSNAVTYAYQSMHEPYPASSALAFNPMYTEASQCQEPSATQSQCSGPQSLSDHSHCGSYLDPTPSLTFGQSQSTVSEFGNEDQRTKAVAHIRIVEEYSKT